MFLLHFFRFMGRLFLAVVFPHCCCLCNAPFTPLCNRCIKHLDFCTQVETSLFYPHLNLQAVCRFDQNSRKIIHSYKYRNIRDLGPVIARLMYLHVPLPNIEYITSIPPDPARKKQRGFDHTKLIAQSLAIAMNVPYLECFSKKRTTRSQTKTTSKKSRQENLREIFTFTQRGEALLTQQKASLLLIDDVCTTGATLEVCTSLLEKYQIQTYSLVFLARI